MTEKKKAAVKPPAPPANTADPMVAVRERQAAAVKANKTAGPFDTGLTNGDLEG